MPASYYRNGHIYFAGNSTQTINPANYLTNAPRGDQVDIGVTVAALNRSGVYSTTANIPIFTYSTTARSTERRAPIP